MSAMFFISDFVTIINITRIKTQKNTMFAKVVNLLFSLNNVFAFTTK